MSLFRTILFATDFTPASAPAFEEALRVAREHGSRLLLAHAYQVRGLPELGFAAVSRYEEWDRTFRDAATRQLEPLLTRARSAGVEVEPLLLEGFPDEAIVGAARQHRVDLVVVGTHGRRGAARVFLGSVAARVVATAGCPVLAVPSPAAPA